MSVASHLSFMTDELGEHDTKQETTNGFLGQTGFTRKASNGANEFVMISYWRSIEDVHAYAYGPRHLEAWRWVEKTFPTRKRNYIGLMHEVYQVDGGMWEGVYSNFQPTLAGESSLQCLLLGAIEYVFLC